MNNKNLSVNAATGCIVPVSSKPGALIVMLSILLICTIPPFYHKFNAEPPMPQHVSASPARNSEPAISFRCADGVFMASDRLAAVRDGVRATPASNAASFSGGRPCYPHPDDAGEAQRRVSELRARGVWCCGRMGGYQYLDMDATIRNVMDTIKEAGL